MHFTRITTVATVALCSVSSVLATWPISHAQRAILERREYYKDTKYTLPNGTVVQVNTADLFASPEGSTSGASQRAMSLIQLTPLTMGIWAAGALVVTFI